MKTTQILIAGFGGQGILFAGKFLAYKGLLEDLQVSWLPSYGPAAGLLAALLRPRDAGRHRQLQRGAV